MTLRLRDAPKSQNLALVKTAGVHRFNDVGLTERIIAAPSTAVQPFVF